MKYAIGVDVGGTNIKAGICTLEGEIVAKSSIKTCAGTLSGEEIIANICQEVDDLLKSSKISREEVSQITVGSPGAVDNKKGVLVFAGNLYARNWQYRQLLQKHFDLPIYVVNDANAAALAETRVGAGRGCQSSITITIGTGIGSGVVIDGRIFTGANGIASELGHMVIVKDGIPCTCGRKGCFERYASATGLIDMTQRTMSNHPESSMHRIVAENNGKVSGRTAFEAAKEGDETGKLVVREYVSYLGTGIANLINAFMPEIVLIGGGVSNEGDYFIKLIEEATLKECFLFEEVDKPRFARALLGNDAGIIGAALFGMDCLRDEGLDN